MLKFFVTETLGETRHLTPEGYLLCVGVPVARTGEQEYADYEMEGFIADKDKKVIAERPENVVFSDETIASFEGKPFTDGHPPLGVDVNTWNTLARGHVQNVRRGTGEQSDLLLADIMVTDRSAISLIDSGIEEISCGYDAEYEQVEDGRVVAKSIIGNHVALVPQGRAGHRVKIGDEDKKQKKEDSFVDKKKTGFAKVKDAILKAFGKHSKDEVIEVGTESKPSGIAEAIAEEVATAIAAEIIAPDEGAEPSDTFDAEKAYAELADMIKEMGGKVDGLMSSKGDSGQPEAKTSNDEKGKSEPTTRTSDAKTAKVPTVDAEAVAGFRKNAEILSPGFNAKAFTFDSKESVCDAMREVLKKACAEDQAVSLDAAKVLGCVVKDWKGIEDAEVKAAFMTAANLKAGRNNNQAVIKPSDFVTIGDSASSAGYAKNVKKFWNERKKGAK